MHLSHRNSGGKQGTATLRFPVSLGSTKIPALSYSLKPYFTPEDVKKVTYNNIILVDPPT